MFAVRSAARSLVRSSVAPRVQILSRTLVCEPHLIDSLPSPESKTHPCTSPATRYTIDHEWISYDDQTSIGTIGITDYAQHALGDVVYVELPSVSTEVAAGGELSPAWS